VDNNRAPLQTNRLRVLAALALGAVVFGAAFWGSHLLLSAASVEPRTDPVIGAFNPWPFVLSTLLGEAGLLAASPSWWVMHRNGLRQWWWAVVLATAMPLVLVAAIAAFLIVRFGTVGLEDDRWMISVGQIICCGILAALVVWRTAYRRQRKRFEEVF
jgi:hypothetical protein